MSVAAGIPQDNILKKSFHRRNDSGELDVFEAATYFSGHNDTVITYNNNGSSFNHHHHHHHQKMIMNMKDDSRSWPRGGRISLDMPIRHVLNPNHHHHHHHHHQQSHHHPTVNIVDHSQIKKYKQPSSPGGRLASFLNSLFNQSALKKTSSKKSKSKSTTKDDDHHHHDEIKRKRRSSISHFSTNSTTNIAAADSKSFYSNSSSSGFRTPPANYAQTPNKSFKEFKSFAKNNNIAKSTTLRNINDDDDDHKDVNVLSEKEKKLGFSKKFDDRDDRGNESDSSSDLFELENYDLGCYSSGLPVYETTNVDNIKRGSSVTISNASM